MTVGAKGYKTYHVRCFGASDREFQIGVLLPVSEKQRELGQKSVVNISRGGDGLRIRVAVDSPLERFSGTNQLLPSFEVIGVIGLDHNN